MSTRTLSAQEKAALNDVMLQHYANQQHAWNPIQGLKQGHHLDWKIVSITKKVTVGGVSSEQSYEKPVPCVRDKDGNEVDLAADGKYAQGTSNVFRCMMPFTPLRLWEADIAAIQGNNDGQLTAKSRQVVSFQSDTGTELVFRELRQFSCRRLAECLSKWTTQDGAKVSNDADKLEDKIDDPDNSGIYCWVRAPAAQSDDSTSTYPMSAKGKAWMFPFAGKSQPSLSSEDPFPGTDYAALNDADKKTVMSIVQGTNGAKTYGGIQLILPDGTVGAING